MRGLIAATAEQRHHGVACLSARDFRWERGDIKSISLLGNVLARQISADHGAVETILFRNGFLTEASASNVWVVHEGALLGPPKGEHVLEGIRYELLRELCEEEGIAFNLRPIPEAEALKGWLDILDPPPPPPAVPPPPAAPPTPPGAKSPAARAPKQP